MPRVPSSGTGQVAVVAHGCGSAASFVRRALGPALADAGVDLVAVEDRSGDVEEVVALLGARVDAVGASVVGGVSLGAHAAVRVAACRPALDGLLAVLPAWTGRPGRVARLSAAAADEVAALGLDEAVRRVARSGWAGAELATTWPEYGLEGLLAALRATAGSRGPTAHELAAVRTPAGVVGLTDDPYHPPGVARRWARLLPRASVRVVPAAAPATDPAVLGRAAVAAWLTARSGSPSRVP